MRNVSISSTSIKATLPTATKDEKSVVIDGLAELARAGLAGEGRVRLAMRGLEGQDAGVRVAGLFTRNYGDARDGTLWLMRSISSWTVWVRGETCRGVTGRSVTDGTGGAVLDEGLTLVVYLFTGGGEGSAVDPVSL